MSDKFQILSNAYHIIRDLEEEDKQRLREEFQPRTPSPHKSYSYKPYSLEPILKSRKKKNARELLSHLLAFYNLKKYCTLEDETVILIPTTSKRLQCIFGHNRIDICRAISAMIECGLIAIYDNHHSLKHSIAKEYVFNKHTWKLFKTQCEELDIQASSVGHIRRRNYNNKRSMCNTFAFDAKTVRFNSHVCYYKPNEKMTEDQWEDYLLQCLYDNYGDLLSYYQQLADEINQTFYKDQEEFHISYKPSFKWNKSRTAVTKIGIRATNSLVAAKKCREIDDPEHLIYRDDIRRQYNLLWEFDVKSSIPRVTYLLNTGKWMPQDVDFYKLVWDELCKLIDFSNVDWNEQTREIIKYFHMRAYFSTSDMIAAHTKHAISLKGNYDKKQWVELDEIMKAYQQAVAIAEGGKIYDSEIFLHESNIYMSVAKRILSLDAKLYQCYDGFYVDKSIDIETIVREEAEAYYKRIEEIRNRDNREIENREIVEEESIIRESMCYTFAARTEIEHKNAVERERERLKNEHVDIPKHIMRQRETEMRQQMRDLENYRRRIAQ